MGWKKYQFNISRNVALKINVILLSDFEIDKGFDTFERPSWKRTLMALPNALCLSFLQKGDDKAHTIKNMT